MSVHRVDHPAVHLFLVEDSLEADIRHNLETCEILVERSQAAGADHARHTVVGVDSALLWSEAGHWYSCVDRLHEQVRKSVLEMRQA